MQTVRPCGSSIDDRTARRPGRDLAPEAPEHGPSPRGLSRELTHFVSTRLLRIDPVYGERLTWILRPEQTHTYEDQAGTEQTQADPVHLSARGNISFLGSGGNVVAVLT